MKCHRTTAGGFLLALALGLAAVAAAAPAGKVPKQIIFPVIGPAQYFAGDFGAPRPQGPHQGNDIMSARHALAVAAEPGSVEFETGSGRAGCMLSLHGRSGTDYVYIHLNNDLGPTNDNKGQLRPGRGVRQGLEERRKGRRRAARRLRRRLGRRGRPPAAPALRGASERRRGDRPVRDAAGRAATPVLRRRRHDVHAAADRHDRRATTRTRPSSGSRPTRFAGGRTACASTGSTAR